MGYAGISQGLPSFMAFSLTFVFHAHSTFFFLCALYFPCHALLFNMHDHFYSSIYAPSTRDRLFPGAGPLVPWIQREWNCFLLRTSSFIWYALQLKSRVSPTLILSPNIIVNWIAFTIFTLWTTGPTSLICCFIVHSVQFYGDLGNTCVASLLFFLICALAPNAHCTMTEMWPWPWGRGGHIHTNII